MNCIECKKPMRLLEVWDDSTMYAHNIYLCEECGNVVVERVWTNEGLTVVQAGGNVASGLAAEQKARKA